MLNYFDTTLEILKHSLHSIDYTAMSELVNACEQAERSGHNVIVSGLGKNVPICEKFVGTMLSLGLNASFLHTNTAIHGDLGMVKSGDVVILLSKSGSTIESVYLAEQLVSRNIHLWDITFNPNGRLSKLIDHQLVIGLEHEGDQWDIMPNNSTILNLIVLQTIAMQLSIRMGITLEQFKMNHPGGAIGERLRNG